MGCPLHLKLTKSRLCVFCVKMNHFEAHLMVSSRVVDSKVLRMAIQFEQFFSDKKAKWRTYNVRNFRRFLFGTSLIIGPTVTSTCSKSSFYMSGFKFGIGVNKIYSNFAHSFDFHRLVSFVT